KHSEQYVVPLTYRYKAKGKRRNPYYVLQVTEGGTTQCISGFAAWMAQGLFADHEDVMQWKRSIYSPRPPVPPSIMKISVWLVLEGIMLLSEANLQEKN
ncbi:hypothetical protein ACMD2_23731, partial [Ananas comosus]